MQNIKSHSFTLPLRCNYLLRRPAEVDDGTLLVLLLHGHAMTPAQMMTLCAPLVGEQHILASLQGPYQLWVNQDHTTPASVAFHWATRFEAEHSWRLHHDMILRVLGDVDLPAARAVLLGFSQTVSLNYRFVGTHPDAVRGVIGICGGIPGDWDKRPYQKSRAAALHITTREDQYYPPAATEAYPGRLRRYIDDVEFHMLDGAHRIPSAAQPIIQTWLRRISAAA